MSVTYSHHLSSSDDFPSLIPTPASKPPPSQEVTRIFVNAYNIAAAQLLKSSSQYFWDKKQIKCANRLKILCTLVRDPPPSMHPDWDMFYETVTAVLRNPLQPITDIFQFSKIIQCHKDIIEDLESRNNYAKKQLIQLLEDLDNPSDPDDHSRAIDATLSLLDHIEVRLNTTRNALIQFAGV